MLVNMGFITWGYSWVQFGRNLITSGTLSSVTYTSLPQGLRTRAGEGTLGLIIAYHATFHSISTITLGARYNDLYFTDKETMGQGGERRPHG